MTSFVYDFKDIATRMKGGLKVPPQIKRLCPTCRGNERPHFRVWTGVPIQKQCRDCDGTGKIEP